SASSLAASWATCWRRWSRAACPAPPRRRAGRSREDCGRDPRAVLRAMATSIAPPEGVHQATLSRSENVEDLFGRDGFIRAPVRPALHPFQVLDLHPLLDPAAA